MAMNRKAFVFSFVVLLALIVIFAAILHREAVTDPSATGLHEHILSANNFMIQLEEDLERVLQITGYRSLLGLEEHISSTGEFLQNLSEPFAEVMFYGSVDGAPYSIMDNATLTEFEKRMQGIASGLGLDLKLVLDDVRISHVSPFNLMVNSTLTVALTTRDGKTSWNYTTNISRVFKIYDLKDPLHTVGTAGRVPNVIVMSNVTKPYITPTNDTSRLQTLLNNSWYINNTKAPSFLMRFTGNLSASPYGISALIDTKELESQDLTVYTDRSVVDFLYFGNQSTTTNRIVNMPAEFLLDDEHLPVYDAEGKTV